MNNILFGFYILILWYGMFSNLDNLRYTPDYLVSFVARFNLNPFYFSYPPRMVIVAFVKFLPFIYFLPVIFDKCKDMKYLFKVLFIIIVCLEFLQAVLLSGVCDIWDVILGYGTCVVAYYVYHQIIVLMSTH